MALSILNNIPSLAAQNQLAITGSNLQKTLFRLSSGSRINSGADDAAGLAIADGLHANITALTQSARNANDGVGKLQVADGALAQITALLNRAVTLATESATGTVSNTQRDALNAEFTAIKDEIDRIGNNTTFNGIAIFQGTTAPDPNQVAGNAGSITMSTALTNAATTAFTFGGKTVTFTAGASSTVADLVNYLNDPATGKGLYAYIASTGANAGNLVVKDTTNSGDVAFDGSSTETALGNFANPTVASAGSTDIYLSDSTSTGASTISVTIGPISSTALNHGSSSVSLGSDSLTSNVDDATAITNAKTALGHINQAIANIASIRGDIGAGINRLQSAVTVMQNQTQNLSAAEDGIRAADIASEVANLTKYSILNQTGISALAQANQMQQSVLSLLK
jgi:flagellin